ncbi:MAG: FapA family protein, partial [Chloroflexota bacterium]
MSSDRMTALLTLPDVEGSYTEDEVRAQLQQTGVVHGINWSELSLLLAEGKSVQHVAVAFGTAPTPGVDGHIEYLFKSGTEGLAEHGGRVDWRGVSAITSVEAGTPVARKIPAVPGEPGVNVLGHQVPARQPRDVRVALGTGTALAEDDANVVLATVSGAARLDVAGKVTVDNTYLVRGDVDLTTGNVDFDGSVVIDKDVRRGFSIKATGDVEVTGLIEEASIIAGGSIIAVGGVVGGSGAASLQAGRDIVARFANQATLLAGHDVILGQEAINCRIEAEGRIAVGGSVPTRGFIRGGTLRAAQSISAYTVGAARGSRTELQVGYDWLLPRKLQSVEAELQTRQGQLEKTRAQLHELQGERAQRELGTEQRLLLEKLRLADEALRV